MKQENSDLKQIYNSFNISDEIKKRNDIFGSMQSNIATIGQSPSFANISSQPTKQNTSASQLLANISFEPTQKFST